MKQDDPTRRDFLTGQGAWADTDAIHISSAVVSALPIHCDEVVRMLEAMPGVEVHHRTESKIVIVIEASDSGEIGTRLIEIAGLHGVLSANMVFEQRLDSFASPGARA